MLTRPLYRAIAEKLQAIENCRKSGNLEWEARHGDAIEELVNSHMPSGSGFDNGTTLDTSASTPDKLVFQTAFHHMDENGMYAGWTDHSVTIKASLASGFDMRIGGRDRNGIKDYIAECFSQALEVPV